MAEYYIQLLEGDPMCVREIPLGIFEGRWPEEATRRAARQCGLSSLPSEAFSATPLRPTAGPNKGDRHE